MLRSFDLCLPATVFLLLLPVLSHSQGSPNVQLLAHVNSYPSAGYNDCWGYTAPNGREYALLGVQNGTSIVDITNAPAVTEVTFIPSSTSLWKDIKTYRQYAYVVNESGGGMQIIDLSNLPISATLVGTYNGFTTSHNIYIDTANAILYAEGSAGQPVRAISLANPLNPVQVSFFGIECHDVYARNNIAYVSEGGSGTIGIYDLSVPAAPVLLRRFGIPSPGYVHNAWLSDDGRFLMTTEETAGKSVKLWDISNLNNIHMTDDYLASPNIAHNTHVKGDYAYISYYTDGLRIVDISDPNNIFEAGYYDTYPTPGGGFDGAWGAFPFFASGKVLISDMQTGLYVVYFAGAVESDALDPNPPANQNAYSDYSTPTSIRLTWTDPATLFNGTPIQPSEFVIAVVRDTLNVATVPGGTQQYVDVGLTDGREYNYTLYAKVIANDSTSRKVRTKWIAGGSPVPRPPTNVNLSGNASQVRVFWKNPSTNVDGTPLDDLAGLRLYQNGVPVATFSRASADTSRSDSATYVPAVPGQHSWYLTSIDNEIPQNESESSQTVFTPMSLPVSDNFLTLGPPDATLWINRNADVNGRATSPPSSPYSLNLNAHPFGGDTVDLRPIDLTGMQTNDLVFSYYYQPQGTGNAPEVGDSLIVHFRNDAGAWIKVRAYAGRSVQPFQLESIDIAAAPNGGGSYFHSQFQIRFRSLGTSDPTSFFDDWFIDNVVLSGTTGAGDPLKIPLSFGVSQNYPNPFNPKTSFKFEVPSLKLVTLRVFDVLGREVATLVNEVKEPGSYRVQWDASAHASGVYFYRLTAGNLTETRRMLLLR